MSWLELRSGCFFAPKIRIWAQKSVLSVTRRFRSDSRQLGKPLHKKSTVQTVFVQIAFQPPHPQANGRFVGAIFAENQSIF